MSTFHPFQFMDIKAKDKNIAGKREKYVEETLSFVGTMGVSIDAFPVFRSDAEVLAGKRRSMFTAGEKLEAEERSPEDTAGADTEAEVVRRQAKLGALGGDVLAEMRYC